MSDLPRTPAYTMALTSCGRHDLLHRVIDSFISCIDVFPVRTVIVEDGPLPRPDWFDYPQLGEVLWLSNGKRMGQGYTVDRAYAHVETDLVFHAEDDWEFVKAGPIISKSAEILSCFAQVIVVMLMNAQNWTFRDPSFPFLLYKPSVGGLNPLYDCFAFGCGLRRMSDYRALGGNFARYEENLEIEKMKSAIVELYVGQQCRERGYIMADLGETYVGHIGAKSCYVREVTA